MPERERLEYEPDTHSFVNELADRLEELVGPSWTGWHFGDPVPGAALWAMFEPDADGRQVLTGVLLLGESIDAETLRRVPVTALENSRNLSRSLSATREMEAELEKLPPLARGELGSEEFSRLVADHYSIWASAVPHPAAAMAARADVKLPTVHSWIREARLRGFLPPAKKSRR